ncbi:MAG: YwiC-like family protein [Chloroflexi bacterium]|nr:YwiC-like family protein [Chloroflexota bacterium]
MTAVKIRSVALPAEHGGWGFLLEPILLGLLVAPSLAGLWLAVGVGGMFLTRQPLKITLADRRRGRRFARTAAAERFVLAYGAVSLLGFAAAVLAAGPAILLPMALGLPFMVVQLAYDFANRSRAALPELAGPLALASVGSSIALAGGWMFNPALALWALLAARALPSVLYVRARLRLEHGKPTAKVPPLIAQGAGILAALALWADGLAPLLASAGLLALLMRAALGLYHRVPTPAKAIGFREIAFGLLVVALVALGFAWGL